MSAGLRNEDSTRTYTFAKPRGTRVRYSFLADSGYRLVVVAVNDDSAAATGTLVVNGNGGVFAIAEHVGAIGPLNKKLYDLERQQSTATDILGTYVEIDCEIERLMNAYPVDADRLITEAGALATDPVRDRKALTRIDDALAGHVFSGCARDRAQFKKPAKAIPDRPARPPS